MSDGNFSSERRDWRAENENEGMRILYESGVKTGDLVFVKKREGRFGETKIVKVRGVVDFDDSLLQSGEIVYRIYIRKANNKRVQVRVRTLVSLEVERRKA